MTTPLRSIASAVVPTAAAGPSASTVLRYLSGSGTPNCTLSPFLMSALASAIPTFPAPSIEIAICFLHCVGEFPPMIRRGDLRYDAALPAECLDDQAGGLRAGEVLLASHQVCVADREASPQSGLN